MAIDNIPLIVSENTQEVVLDIDDTSHPYYVGARAYVTQIPEGAIVTVIDKFGKTEAVLLDGNQGNITDISYDPDTKTIKKINGVVTSDLVTLSDVAISNDYDDLDNLPALSTVALSNDYEDLDNLPDLDQTISDWLDENPIGTARIQDESITTAKYEDGSVTIDKIANSYKRDSSLGHCISPIYVGDYITDVNKVPSSVIKIGDYFYSLDAPSDSSAQSTHSNAGTIRKFDIVNNKELKSSAITANIAHANSIAYDTVNNRIYVAPVWDYSTSSKSNAEYLYVFDDSLNSLGTVQLPTQAMGVSYDHVNSKLYYFDYSQNIYSLDNGVWTLRTHVDFTGISENNRLTSRSYNQDFAVYDNKFYVSSPWGNIVWGYLKPTTSSIIGSYVCIYKDSTNRFALGELEGMEFDSGGHLYAVYYVDIGQVTRNAFIVELPVNTCVQYSTGIGGSIFGVKDATLTLSESTQSCFALNTYWIRSLNQLRIMTFADFASNITIPANNVIYDEDEIVLNKDLHITLAGTLRIKNFSVFGGNLVLRPNDTSGNELLLFTTNSSAVSIARGGRLTFGSQSPLHVSTPNASAFTINVGYTQPITILGQLPTSIESKSIVLGTTTITQAGMYRGSTFIG